jgi:hypothetical protein
MASEKLENVRVPGRNSDVAEDEVFSPNIAGSRNAAALVTMDLLGMCRSRRNLARLQRLLNVQAYAPGVVTAVFVILP